MNLLSNLIQFSNNQSSSLSMVESPKIIDNNKLSKQMPLLMSARKQEEATPQKRMASKSLSKMGLLAFNNKIDPRERLIHRMVHKLQMKCRKQYYYFFVVLEDLKRNNIRRCKPELPKTIISKITSAVQKIQQLQQIYFSKYFQGSLKKQTFRSLKKWGDDNHAFDILAKVVNKKNVGDGFKQLYKFSEKKYKECIRMDILCSSIGHLNESQANLNRINDLKHSFSKIKNYVSNHKKLVPTKSQQDVNLSAMKEIITPKKCQANLDNTAMKTQAIMPFMSSPIHPSYQNLKKRKMINEESPGKQKQPLKITCRQSILKFEKRYNFIKAYKNKTILEEQYLVLPPQTEPNYLISKRCEPDTLNCRLVPDINDKNTIFFNQLFYQQNSRPNSNQISQSSVQSVDMNNLYGFLSEQINCNSQVSLINPLRQNGYQPSSRLVTNGSVKSSAFGAEAVNFKNSLVIERQAMRENPVEKNRQKKELSFMKIKNQVKLQKKAQAEYQKQIEALQKIKSRFESAQKDYSSLKYRKQSDFSINIPQQYPYQISNSMRMKYNEYPEPDFTHAQNSERKNLSLMSNNKSVHPQQQQRKGTPNYLKIVKKIDN